MINTLNLLSNYYIEVDVVCIAVLAILAYQTVKSNFTKSSMYSFLAVLLTNMLFAFTDMIWVFNNEFHSLTVFGSYGITFSYIVNGLNILYSALSGLSWLYFSELVQDHSILNNHKERYASFIPFAILLVLTLTTGKTHFMFYITDSGKYIRGAGYAIQILISYGYILLAVALSIIRARHSSTEMSRKRSITMAGFMIMPSICVILQLLIRNMPIIFIGTIIALINVYTSLQSQMILIDPLTGLNNRSQLDQKIVSFINDLDNNELFYVCMIDADKFKHINDNYGHLEGDRALVAIADILKLSCTSQHDFVCRYGGDEFTILHKSIAYFSPLELENSINSKLAEADFPYPLSVSIGGACYNPSEMHDWAELLKATDKDLYRTKQRKQSSESIHF